MSARKNYLPTGEQPDTTPEEMGAIVETVSQLRKLPPVNPKDTAEIEERIDRFFKYCVDEGLRPTVTLLSAALGVRRETVWKWEQEDSARGKAIERAKGLIEALTEEWLASGKISPPSGIFILKNHFGWRDTVEVAAVRTSIDENLPTAEDIAKRLPRND